MDLSEIILTKDLQTVRNTFNDDAACDAYLVKKRWSQKIMSPFDPESKVYECSGGRYRCKNTKKYFNVRTKTLFHNTKVPLQIWFEAIWTIANHSKVTSVALAEALGLTQKTAWFMLRRINRYLIQNELKQRNAPPFRPTPTKQKIAHVQPDHKLPMSEWLGLLRTQ